MTTTGAILRGYADAAEDQIARMESFDPAVLLASVLPVLRSSPGRMLDVGAGTGYVAGWFIERGYEATAAEPVAAFRDAGERIRGDSVRWLDDQAPQLAVVRALGERFDLILLSAVWQHLDQAARVETMESLSALLADGGQVVLSLRHGPGAATRPVFACTADEAVALGARHGLSVRLRVEAASLQAVNRASGVTWTWLILER